ncbi:PorP/SprF family type IX secretion system membrane protein [Pontibacter sp. MBLB2868]|uniref:PorP/SprF family type IX secretion system membrane protein n=1 Tax=Pontibacter sp. MBLB2868 TaxID=3451555 RepID=UPI003F755104
MKKVLLQFSVMFCLVLLSTSKGFGQQDAMYSQYMFNGLILNPAYAGSSDGISASALYRNQWVNIEGAPVTQTLSVHAPFRNNNVGLGLAVVNDKIGVTNNLSMNGIYAFRIKTEAGVIAMGLQAGIIRHHADYTNVQTNPQGNPDENFSDVQDFLMFNFGNGFYYHTDKFYAGLSVPGLFRAKISGSGNKSSYYPEHTRHYYLSTGYVFTLSDKVKVKPSTLVRVAEGAPVQFDINTNVWLYNTIGLGASYRSGNTLVGILELQVSKQFRLGYSYDQPVADISRYTASTHEVMLRFDVAPSGSKFVSPRFF